jgi:integral membrane sensor domain MASE1
VKDSLLNYLIKAVLIFAVYFATARLGLSLDAVSGFATVVWPPTGIALAAIFILGYRFWPAIMLGAFLVNYSTGAPALVALGIGIGNTSEAILGSYILKRFVYFQTSIERLRDAIGLVALAAPISTAVSATIGTTSLLLGGVIVSSAYAETWSAWWLGDMLGALVVAPLLIVWGTNRFQNLNRKKIIEVVALFFLLIFMSFVVFGNALHI